MFDNYFLKFLFIQKKNGFKCLIKKIKSLNTVLKCIKVNLTIC